MVGGSGGLPMVDPAIIDPYRTGKSPHREGLSNNLRLPLHMKGTAKTEIRKVAAMINRTMR